jgi:hypothetical protein
VTDRPVKCRSVTDGAMTDGAMANRAMPNGTMNNGTMTNGTMMGGRMTPALVRRRGRSHDWRCEHKHCGDSKYATHNNSSALNFTDLPPRAD